MMGALQQLLLTAVVIVTFVAFAATSDGESSHRTVLLTSVDVNTMSHPAFHSDHQYHSYLQGGVKRWPKVDYLKTIERDSGSDSEKHSYLIHFKSAKHIKDDEKALVEQRINQLGGCHRKVAEFSFRSDSFYYASNSFLVHCSESTMTELAQEFENSLWIGSWLPSYKYHSTTRATGQVYLRLIGVNSIQEANKLSKNLKTTIKSVFHIDIEFLHVSTDRILFDLPEHDVPVIFDFLSHQRFVHYISMRPTYKSLNQNAAWIMQDNIKDDYTFYKMGLTGKGQIVAVADSGLDYDNCMFDDPNVPVPLNKTDYNHRKIVAYHALPDCPFEDKDGHGTHTAGSIAGNAVGSRASDSAVSAVHLGTGIAFEAKLSFLGIADQNGKFVLPPNLNSIYALGYNDGARIHSDSWGCSGNREHCNVYDAASSETDAFMYDHPDMLILFAAGNDGDYYSDGLYSVSSPAVAKNIISVGASQNDVASFANISYYIEPEFGVADDCSCSQVLEERCLNLILQSYSYYTNQTDYNQNNLAYYSARGPADYTKNSTSISGKRLKPDIVAPGLQIVSAFSDGDVTTFQCENMPPCGTNPAALIAMEGTSMSAPVAAGLAALIRQYFEEGHYNGESINPPASLVKALIIASADALVGTYYRPRYGDFAPFPLFPNYYAGYGIPRIGNILNTTVSTNSLFIDYTTSLHTGFYKIYPIAVSSPAAFRVALAWTDFPGSIGSSSPLVNDLDLNVYSPTGKLYRGNNRKDHSSNTEAVLIKNPESGIWGVVVKATNVPIGPQTFSIVVGGGTRVDYPSSPQPPAANEKEFLECATTCKRSCKQKLGNGATKRRVKKCKSKCIARTCF